MTTRITPERHSEAAFEQVVEDHLLLLTMHHIISDGWSLNILVKEIAAFYQAILTGKLPTLEPLPIQYADYAIWQREQLHSDALEQGLEYWPRKLSGPIPPLQVPTDYPRPRVQRYRGQKPLVRACRDRKPVRLEQRWPREETYPVHLRQG